MSKIAEKYGAFYFNEDFVRSSPECDLYAYAAYSGGQVVDVNQGDSLITLSRSLNFAHWVEAGSYEVHGFGVVLRGYKCGTKSASLNHRANLPYVNGCASRQIFAPERQGDPTLQMLTIPPHTSEQVHHIHPTARVVYILKGRGYSIVGQAGETEETELVEGMVCILDPMSPHHFRTEDEWLTVLPMHIYSSTILEGNHPMFNGTREV